MHHAAVRRAAGAMQAWLRAATRRRAWMDRVRAAGRLQGCVQQGLGRGRWGAVVSAARVLRLGWRGLQARRELGWLREERARERLLEPALVSLPLPHLFLPPSPRCPLLRCFHSFIVTSGVLKNTCLHAGGIEESPAAQAANASVRDQGPRCLTPALPVPTAACSAACRRGAIAGEISTGSVVWRSDCAHHLGGESTGRGKRVVGGGRG